MLFGFERVRTVLCLGAHSDDIEIGCGGTILSLLAARADLEIHWVVLSGDTGRVREAQASCDAFCQGARRVHFANGPFRDSYFPYDGGEIKAYFHALSQRVRPDVIFTHCRHDLHQDHRITAELTWNAFRNALILEYEIPKWDGDLGQPNIYVPLSESLAERKLDLLSAHFGSQHDKPWFDRETFAALLRIRGVESKSPSRYAEAFYGRKLLVWPTHAEGGAPEFATARTDTAFHA